MHKTIDGTGLAKKVSTTEFYDSVRKEYFRMKNVRREGVALYTNDYIMAMLSKKFFRSKKTIENILFNRV